MNSTLLEKWQEEDFEFLGQQIVGRQKMRELMEDKGLLVKFLM